MHKGVICLTKAEDKDEAVSNVNEFLEQYGDGDVWDWYVVGGRWSGILNEKEAEFDKRAKQLLKEAYPENEHGFIMQNMIDEQKDALQKIWEELGQTNKNPYSRDQYKDRTGDDDVMPLANCIEVVNTWKRDTEAEAEGAFQKMLEARAEEKEKGMGTMSGYYAGIYRDLKYDSFSFESNVYDIDNQTNNPEEALKEPEKWFAVMIDMHN